MLTHRRKFVNQTKVSLGMHKLFFILIFQIVAHCAAASFSELKQNEIPLLEEGQLVLHNRHLKDHPWPERMLFLLIKASPLESMAVFAAYEYQKKYVPNMLKSEVVEHISPTKTVVDYEMHVPWPLSNAVYTQKHDLVKRSEQYVLFWDQVQSNATLINRGSVSFHPYKKNPKLTLMIYNALVKPDSVFAGMVKSKAQEDLLASIKTIRDHIEHVREKMPKLMLEQKNLITGALSGKYVYQGVIETRKSK